MSTYLTGFQSFFRCFASFCIGLSDLFLCCSHPEMQDMLCMLQTGPTSLLMGGHQDHMLEIDVNTMEVRRKVKQNIFPEIFGILVNITLSVNPRSLATFQ